MTSKQTHTSGGEGQGQSEQVNTPGQHPSAAARGGGAAGESGVSTHQTASRADQERQRPVSREATSSGAGSGVQRNVGGELAGGGAGQFTILPALMANPGLLTSAFLSNPFGFAQAMSQEMDRLFATPGFGSVQGGRQPTQGTPGGSAGRLGRGHTQWVPQMEVAQRGNELVVRADLPGLSSDDVQIEVEDGVLTISGERQQANEDRQEGFYRSERSYGTFTRSIALPDGIDDEQVQARFENGVLEVTVPLPQQRTRGRRIEIQSGRSTAGSREVTSGKAASTSAGNTSSGTTGSSASATGSTESSRSTHQSL